MGTPFTEIYDLALIVINDTKINKLYEYSLENKDDAFYTYMEGFLIRAIPLFDGSLISLDFDLNTKAFKNELSIKEKDVLANIIERLWWKSELNVDEYIALGLQGRDRKTHSEASNINAKSDHMVKLREEISQIITNYQLDNFDAVLKGW